MAAHRPLGYLLAVVALCAACRGKKKPSKATAGDLDQRCEQLATACGDTPKHAQKIAAECKQAAKQEVEKGCADSTIGLYDCYHKALWGKSDPIWALDDLRVLAKRNSQCVA